MKKIYLTLFAFMLMANAPPAFAGEGNVVATYPGEQQERTDRNKYREAMIQVKQDEAEAQLDARKAQRAQSQLNYKNNRYEALEKKFQAAEKKVKQKAKEAEEIYNAKMQKLSALQKQK